MKIEGKRLDDEGRRYNRVFETYVKKDDDLEGLVAYALYKSRKRAWIIETKEQEGAEALDQKALDDFERSMTLEQTIKDFREKADSALAAYATVYVDLQTPQIREEAISKELFDARESIKRPQSYPRQIVQSLIVSGITVLVLVGLVVAAHIFGIDPLEGVQVLKEAIE